MTDHRDARPTIDHGRTSAARRIAGKVYLARLALFWERLWPPMAQMLVVLAAVIGLAFLGLFDAVPGWARYVLLALAVAAVGYVLWPLRHLRWPSLGAARHRVEDKSDLEHRPLTAIEDDLAIGADDPAAQALWDLHRRRMAARLAALKAGTPSPRFYLTDPIALRVVAAIILVVGFFYAGDQRFDRLASMVSGPSASAAVSGRIDAWIAPPDYTGRPPLFLTGDQAPPGDRATIDVPQYSRLIVRVQGYGDVDITARDTAGTLAPLPETEDKPGAPAADSAVRQAEYTLKSDADISVQRGGGALHHWRFSVIIDTVPTIELASPPQTALTGAVKLIYDIEDDYGVVAAGAQFTLVDATDEAGRRPLFEAPDFALTTPRGRTRTGRAETFHDLTAHPWAGADVNLVLVARDEADQEGRSKPERFTLPQRRFSIPLAKAVVEQRRILALDANRHVDVIAALDALLIGPEEFFDNPGHYLALKFAYHRLTEAKSDDQLRKVVDDLWSLALVIEDGDLSLAERALRDAQEALQQALQEGASDEEIQRLTQELRQALDRYMKSLAEQARRNPQMARPMDPNARALRGQDLNRMIDRIEDLARSGARDAAQEMLAQLQHMLENLQTGRMQNGGSQAAQELGQMLDQLGEMIQRQQDLMEQTYQYGPNSNRPGEQNRFGQSPQSRRGLGEALRQLGRGQGDLRQQLEGLLDDMREMGINPNNNLGRAGRSMRGAEEALGQSRAGTALGRQGEALNALRRGAQGLVQQLLGMRRDQAGQHDPAAREEDPLGRPRQTDGPDLGLTVKVPDEIDIQRARRILKELRRRLGESARPRLERDYLERLLTPY